MPRYGKNLEEILLKRNKALTKSNIFHLALNLLNILELVHSSGFVFNDLKPDNIMIDYGQKLCYSNDVEFESSFNKLNFNLIDFGLASKWIDKVHGKHVANKKQKYFKGNLYFSSVNQLAAQTSSRRDDLHSLIYLIIYLLNKNHLPLLMEALHKDKDFNSKWLGILRIKQANSLSQFSVERAKCL